MAKNKSLEETLRSILATDVSRIDPVPRAKEEILQSILSLDILKDEELNELHATKDEMTFEYSCVVCQRRFNNNRLRAELRTKVREWVNRV